VPCYVALAELLRTTLVTSDRRMSRVESLRCEITTPYGASATLGRMAEEEEPRKKPEDRPGEPGAEGGSSGSADSPPPVPDEDDDSPLGDTDQHSDAAA